MATQELKKICHELIDTFDDEVLLQVYSILDSYKLNKKGFFNELSSFQLSKLENSIKQANDGNLIPHEQVKAKFSKWLSQ